MTILPLESKPVSLEEPQKQYEGMLIFAIGKDGKVDILYDFQVMNSKSAARYAELIYSVNEGHFERQIMQHLLSINTNSTTNSFIKKVVKHWSHKCQDIRPAVRPMTIFRKAPQDNDE